MMQSTSDMLMSVALSPVETKPQQLEIKEPEINYKEYMYSLINRLHLSQPTEGVFSSVTSWFATSVELTEEQKIYNAHNSLLQACIKSDVEAVKAALALVKDLPLTQDAKVALIQTNACHDKLHPKEIYTLGLFGYVLRKDNIEIINLFIEAGADVNEKDSITKMPYFFKLISNPKAHFYREIRNCIDLYLEKGFDINTPKNNESDENILMHVYGKCINNPDYTYPIYLLANKISRLVTEKKIDPDVFVDFASSLHAHHNLKEFPNLAALYAQHGLVNAYTNSNEEKYYTIRAVICCLESFCKYEKERLKKWLLGGYLPAIWTQKNEDLQENISKIHNIKSQCKLAEISDELSESLGAQLMPVIKALGKVFSEERGVSLQSISFFSSGNDSDRSSISQQEWKAFLEDNAEVKFILENKSNKPKNTI